MRRSMSRAKGACGCGSVVLRARPIRDCGMGHRLTSSGLSTYLWLGQYAMNQEIGYVRYS